MVVDGRALEWCNLDVMRAQMCILTAVDLKDQK